MFVLFIYKYFLFIGKNSVEEIGIKDLKLRGFIKDFNLLLDFRKLKGIKVNLILYVDKLSLFK